MHYHGPTGLKTMDEVLKSGRALKMGATRAGSTYNDLPKILNQTIGTKFDVITGYKGTSQITVGMRSKELDGGCWGWESIRVVARAMLDAQGDQKLIPIIVHSKWEDKELAGVPLTRDYIMAKGGKDGVELYNAWVNQYEFQRPWVAPPSLPKDRLEILRKAFKDTLDDPEFKAEAKKSQARDGICGRERDQRLGQRNSRHFAEGQGGSPVSRTKSQEVTGYRTASRSHQARSTKEEG